MIWPFRRRGRPDLDGLLRDLSTAHPGRGYRDLDRYRDFRAVFLGDARGRRVLWEILSICRLYRSSMHESAAVTAFNEGKRDVGLRILSLMNAEPAEKPNQGERSQHV